MSMDDEQIEMVSRVWQQDPKSIVRIGFRFGPVTTEPSDIKVTLQDVDLT